MMHNSTDESEWEVRPGGMLVQRRDDDAAPSDQPPPPPQDPDSASAAFSQTIRISVSHGSSSHHDLHVSVHATFGDVKKAIVQKTGLEATELKILFRGVERDDAEQLQAAGVKDASKLVLVEDQNKRVEQQVEQPPLVTEETKKAIAAILAVTEEVDKLSDRVVALEVAVNGGTKVAVKEFDMTAELLMRQLLKLDGINAEGDARLQRKAEVRRVQILQESVDKLKARCSNPFVDQSKAAAVSTEWESYGNGVGSLNPPPPASPSANVTQDWERNVKHG
ncbi:PREDICTED: BAG family molecular chaperone regulator 4 isoform X1 [Camelina sativa]|uniref:BAG family molecular chaperone regulator 4 isoform X1 n=1 Tax=Camelina sativa TaxID=90675 RepID=A0ABM0YP56_CAMSA|nr:PREDICTED: BAG family molecular chaperone regulator 4 isoform X1 [Camelina sativa]